MKYPGRVIKFGETDDAIIGAITDRLASLGYKLPSVTNDFDSALVSLVKLFQSQQVDAAGRPLVADGQIGPMTWGALFGAPTVTAAPQGIGGQALAIAITQIGQMEQPLGSNSGPMVDKYLKSTGLGPGFFWCMAFVHWCFKKAADDAGVTNPFPKTAGCLDAWRKVKAANPGAIITAAQAVAKPSLVKPGCVFILDHGGGLGHTGFVREVSGGALRTVEGNSNPSGSSNGIGVFEINRRKVTESDLLGFINLTG